ncbi:MAG: PocR ligand-binding domain-containing protein [Clostridiaceae bacterium]
MVDFKELINIESLKKIAENMHAITGIAIALTHTDGTIEFVVGHHDICNRFHRVNSITCNRCLISDKYGNEHAGEGECIAYKCLNNMRDIVIPIFISGIHIASIVIGQFFYDDEVIDIEYFRAQAQEFGFNEKEYLETLSKVPVFSKEKVKHIIEFFKGFVSTLAESGLRQLEYKNSQRELEKSQKYLNKIFNSVNEAIILHDFDGNIIDVNSTAVSLYGYSYEEFMDMNINNLIPENSPDNLKKLLNNQEELLNKQKKDNDPLIIECIAMDKNNNEFWVEGNSHIVMINEDAAVLATIRNITERKQAELASKNEALELEKLRTEFFANISHELRTPLNIILGSVKVISMNLEKESIDREKIFNIINTQKQNCFRLLRLINNLIDSTKIDAGYFEPNMVNCNIVNIVEEITLSAVEYIKSNHLNLTFDTDIEEKIIASDLDKVERIILNILSNAVKFTNSGGNIFVNIYDGEEFVTITIEDTGIGINKDKLDIIFDRFRQVDRSFTRNHEGSGIGLSLVKSLVEMQGGTIFAESKYGVGTKFTIKLPVKLIDDSKNNENVKLLGNNLNSHVEKIEIEFSDIYTL